MKKQRICGYVKSAFAAMTLAVIGVTTVTGIAQAGEKADPKAMLKSGMGEPAPALAPAPKESMLSGDFGVAVANEYISRGLVLVDQGSVIQPYLNLNLGLYKGSGFISNVTAFIGFWANVNTEDTFTDGTGMANWYEFDYMPGISVSFAKRLKYTFTYLEFISPSGGFKTAVSLNNSLSFDDAGLIDKSGNFSFQPCFTVLNELDSAGAAGLKKDAMYYEFAINPNYTVLKETKYPLTLSLPVTVGLGDNKFYNGDTFGYCSFGPAASVPLAFIPEQYGPWSASLSYKHYVLGDQAALLTDHGNDGQDVVSFQVGCKF